MTNPNHRLEQALESARRYQEIPDSQRPVYKMEAVALLDEIAQLRGNLSLAEEGLANYALEVEQLKVERDFARRELARACQETREALSREVTALRGGRQKIERLQNALTCYGEHSETCKAVDHNKLAVLHDLCDCGLRQALAGAAHEPSEQLSAPPVAGSQEAEPSIEGSVPSADGAVPAGLVDAKCPNCGAKWKICADDKVRPCMFCGTKLKFTLTAVL